MRYGILSFFLLGVVPFFSFVAAVQATAPANGKIVFVSDRDGNNEIYLMNPDGSGQTRLTDDSRNDHWPAWAPDGRTIAFCRNTGSTFSAIWLMDRDGANPRQIFHSCEGRLAWSPNGQQIAFTTWWGGVAVIPRDGGTVETIETGLTGWDLAWSPDGSRFAFAAEGGSGGAYSNIFTINRNGSGVVQVTNSHAYTSPTAPDWSPDSNELVFADASEGISDNDSISLQTLDGTGTRRILTSPGIVNYAPRWSPDGARIAFSRGPSNGGDSQIWTINRDGSGLRQVTSGTHNNSMPDWQPVPSATAFDYDGDGRSDISVWRPSNGLWLLNRSQAGYTGMNWGEQTDKLVPADYDGDRKTDIAIWRPSSGLWYVVRSSTGEFSARAWGEPGDVPVPADYDGDGKADLAVFRPSSGTWYRINSSNGHWAVTAYAQQGDVPVVSDYDGDGRHDLAVYRPSNGNWYLQQTSAGYVVIQLGSASSLIAHGDYNGDGRTEPGIVSTSSGNWLYYDWNKGQPMLVFDDYYQPGDMPVPADYDGDGRANLAFFRPSGGRWRIPVLDGEVETQFGQQGDLPIPRAMIP